jgi:hypothetical protein
MLFMMLSGHVALIILLLLTPALSGNDAGLSGRMIHIFILSAIWYFFAKPLFRLALKLQVKMMCKDGKSPYGKNNHIQFNTEDINEATELSERKVKYSNIERITESKNSVYVYYSALQAFIIPLSVFESERQKNDFIAFIKRKK